MESEYKPTQQEIEWGQLKKFRDAVFSGLNAHGMHTELALFFTDLFLTNAGEKMEDDPDVAREYMKNVIQIVNDVPRNNTTESTQP